MHNLNNIHIILSNPFYSANVGSCARVMNNFGLKNMRLVTRRKIPHVTTVQAIRLATRQGQNILNSTKIFKNLSEAVADLHVVVATTRRHRVSHVQELHVAEIKDKILSFPSSTQIGFVFGPERT